MSWTAWNNDQIATRIAADIPDGSYVNLGIGRPEAIANHIPADKEIVFQSENGLLGMGPAASGNEVNYELVNAGKTPVTALAGDAHDQRWRPEDRRCDYVSGNCNRGCDECLHRSRGYRHSG